MLYVQVLALLLLPCWGYFLGSRIRLLKNTGRRGWAKLVECVFYASLMAFLGGWLYVCWEARQ